MASDTSQLCDGILPLTAIQYLYLLCGGLVTAFGEWEHQGSCSTSTIEPR